ncbi:MAG: Trk system potassium transporter TrkA [Eubacterium sp.]|nr:Trk system potassium transporter TrkA [Eubacterium sp.]
MKIMIAGDGKVGSMLTKQLSAEGYDITLIDANPRVLETTEEMYDIMAVQGNCATMEVLERAGVEEADLLIAATSADEINLLCCLTAHGMNKKLHTIARVRNPEYAHQIFQMREVFPLSMIVNPEKQAADEIERLLKYPGFLKRDTFAKGRMEIVELRVDADSPLCNHKLADLNSIVDCKVLICAVLREGSAVAPDGTYTLQAGDRIFVTAATDTLATLLKNLKIITHKVKHVLICGGGKLSYYLAKQLKRSGISVRIIESDYDRCVELADLLPGVSVIHGDASDERLLEREGLDESDALVTMTGLDELNMVISLQGTIKQVPQVITKLGRMDNSYILDRMPIGSTVSPKHLCCNTIVQYVRALRNQTGAALSVHSIADGHAEALEFRVDETTKNIGVPLRKLKVRKNVLVVGITHRGTQIIPDGDSYYEKGDNIIVVTSGESIIYQLNDIFEA